MSRKGVQKELIDYREKSALEKAWALLNAFKAKRSFVQPCSSKEGIRD